MSSVYATEPATSGRVILETTNGPLEIHLWCRECPHTTRFFLQLCLDGFYDDMIFHRIVNDFLIQTGALRHGASSVSPTSMTSPEAHSYREAVQASVALERRQYEINSRIRFNHRGQVAMALAIDDNDNVEEVQPQFFITLEDAPYLDGKHVCFGTISGPTIFNALRIGRTEVDESTHQPVDIDNATRIKSVKIVENPIHQDLVPQTKIPWKKIKEEDNKKEAKKKKKRKGKFDTNVLSFGDELVEDTGSTSIKMGMQSSHDVVESKALSKQVDDQVKDAVFGESSKYSDKDERLDKKKKKRKLDRPGPESTNGGSPSRPVAADATSQEVSNTPKGVGTLLAYTSKKKREQEKLGAEQKVTGTSAKDKKNVSLPKERNDTEPSAPKISAVEARRLKYSKGKKSKKEREEETLAKLSAFRSTVQQTLEEKKSSALKSDNTQQDNSLAARMARRAQQADGAKQNDVYDQTPTYYGQVLERDEEENGSDKSSWLATSFMCRRHIDHDSRPDIGGDGRAADEYEVVDSKKHRDHHKSYGKHHHSRKHHHRHER